MPSRTQRQARRNRTERVAIIGLAFVLLIAVAYAWHSFMGSGTPLTTIFGPTGRVNILVLGVDERPDDVGRSDTMFLLTVDPKNQEVSVLSIPRDTRVNIPGIGYDKINHAYGEGKYKLSQRAVENLLGVPINYWVTVDFNGFKRIVDALGGVTIDVDKRMYYQDSWDGFLIDLQPGVQKLDGAHAIEYVRYRDEDGDIGRIERQQKFMKAVMQQVTQPSTIANLPTLVKELYGAVHTNMSVTDMVSYARIFNNARAKGLKSYMVPGTPAYINDISYWLPNITELRKMVAEIMGTHYDDRAVASASQLENEYVQYIPKEMTVVAQPDDKNKMALAAQEKNRETAKSGTTSTTQKPAAQTTSGKIRATIVNASGNPDAAVQMTRELQRQGIQVLSTRTAGSPTKATVVVGSEDVQKRLSSLPFDYNYQVSGSGSDITVIIGRNYN